MKRRMKEARSLNPPRERMIFPLAPVVSTPAAPRPMSKDIAKKAGELEKFLFLWKDAREVRSWTAVQGCKGGCTLCYEPRIKDCYVNFSE